MTCLPTTRDGMLGAIAHYAAARIIASFDAGVQAHPPTPHPTAQSAIDAVCARARSRAHASH
jgi:hypothetical protein